MKIYEWSYLFMVELLHCAYNLHTRKNKNDSIIEQSNGNVLFLYRLGIILSYNTFESKSENYYWKFINNKSELNRKHSIHLINEMKKKTL